MKSLAELNIAGPWDDQRAAADVTIGTLGAVRSLHQAGSSVGALTPQLVTVLDDGSVRVATPDPAVVPTDPRYLVPEGHHGQPWAPADDCYAVGAMLYEMLAGSAPATAPAGEPIPRQVADLRPDVDPSLASIVNKAVAVDPALRYQQADPFREDLLAIRQGLPTIVTREVETVRVAPLPPPPPSRLGPAIALAALIILALGVLLYFLLRDGDTTIPAVAGQPAAVAQQRLTDAGLRVSLAQEQSDQTDPGTAIRTDPPAGTEVDSDSTVVLVIDGQAGGTVPQVVGRTQAQATAALTQAGFEVSAARVANDAAAGTVVEQAPPPGTPAATGSTVALRVSSGPETETVIETVTTPAPAPAPAPPAPTPSAPAPSQVRVPSVVGQSLDDASRAITGAGLAVGTITRQRSDTQPEGTVLSQDPAAGSQADTGSQVTLVTSSGPATP